MDTLAIAYAYEYYEKNQGIEPQLPDFSALKLVPNGAWLAYLGALFLGSPAMINPAIATSQIFTTPVKGAVVNTNTTCLNARRSPFGTVVTCINDGETLKGIVKEDNGWYELESGNWVAKKYVALPATKVAPAVPATTTTPKTVIAPTSATNSPNLFYVKGNMMKGERVRTLQTKLNYYQLLAKPLIVDGVFGPKTMVAVQAYQEQKKLKIDGIVGGVTRQALGM
ncbi:MAG: peptidoglycan-binding protein [Limnothrix sp. RL_2_0]|nr:peptidoglycan-binding protein [Limnothrix sp. RL_2_0]